MMLKSHKAAVDLISKLQVHRLLPLLQGLANLPLMLKASEELWICGVFDGEQFDGWRGQSEGLNRPNHHTLH